MLQAACIDIKLFEGFFKNPLGLKDVSLMFHSSFVSHPSLWMMKGGKKSFITLLSWHNQVYQMVQHVAAV